MLKSIKLNFRKRITGRESSATPGSEGIGPKRPSFPRVGLCRQRVLSIVMLMKLLHTERERNYPSEQFQIIF